MIRRLVVGATILAALALPGAAFADECANVSRPAPADTSDVTIKGNWGYVPQAGAWMMAVPGGTPSTLFDLPGANGNYTNGQRDHLLSETAETNPNRQTTNGIQLPAQP